VAGTREADAVAARGERDRSDGMLARAREFVKEVQVEATKVSWPTRNELRDSTIVVIVTVLIVSVFIGIVDRLLSFGIGSLFRMFR
jgi:preprotein translocase subunit SecE